MQAFSSQGARPRAHASRRRPREQRERAVQALVHALGSTQHPCTYLVVSSQGLDKLDLADFPVPV